MNRIVIIGNSGSGKTTMGHHLASEYEIPHLDLDSLAWERPAMRRPLEESVAMIHSFVDANSEWIVEGCYAGLVESILPFATELRFLNPWIEACVRNCRIRPFEPHKYASMQEQNARLDFLLSWVREYAVRDDEYSLAAHRRIFDAFPGVKREYADPAGDSGTRTSDVHVRLATLADVSALTHHRVSMFRDMAELPPHLEAELTTASDAFFRAAVASGEYAAWLAVTNDASERTVAGAGLWLRPMLPRPSTSGIVQGREALVANVYTEPEWRRRGLAALLMRYLLDYTREQRITRVLLHASKEGRPLYESMGFVPTNEMRLDPTR